jgi:RNA polymerase sigma-70 factor, ECF subfamily
MENPRRTLSPSVSQLEQTNERLWFSQATVGFFPSYEFLLLFVIQLLSQDRNNTVDLDFEQASDAVLVVAIGRMQQPALAEIYRRHGGPSFRLAQRLLNDRRRAEDVVQDIFLQLWNEPHRFDPSRGSLRSWLLLKTHSKAVDALRAENARRAREDRVHSDPSNDRAYGFDLEREVLDMAIAERVQQAMGSLPEQEQQAIRLAYFGGHTYREVAEVLGEPEGTTKSRIRSGLKTLRRSLHDLRSESGPNINTNPAQTQQRATAQAPNAANVMTNQENSGDDNRLPTQGWDQ